MKVAVMGAGAVGSYFGAVLARAGHEVMLIGRPSHIEAIAARGLLVEAKTFQGYVPIGATTEPSGVAGTDVVLVSVKSGDTEAVGRLFGPHLDAHTAVLSLQNGVDNADRLAEVLGSAIVPAAVYVATEITAPGHVKHRGRGEMVIGPSLASQRIAEAFTGAGIPTTVSDDVLAALWSKLTVNCAYNALSAVSQLPYGQIFNVGEVADVVRDVVAECTAVAQAMGVVMPPDTLHSVLALAGDMPGQVSSTAQDLARGRRSEVDFLNGFVVRKGTELGISTSANRALLVMVKLIERRNVA
ncbi:MAG: 2-dehydropantoate 2-reductase [Mesorhizobium sp.]|nr:MAG: 2-dehydropantoate 2-reductase [Mesorhizobium sp.]